MKRISAILLLLLLALPGCNELDVEETYYDLVNPTPANGAMAVDPGEPAVTSMDQFPELLTSEYYQSFLASRGDTLFWLDFNGNCELDPASLNWEERSNMSFPANGYMSRRIYFYIGEHPSTPLSLEDFAWKEPYAPLLPNTMHWWTIEVRRKILGAPEEEPGNLIATSPLALQDDGLYNTVQLTSAATRAYISSTQREESMIELKSKRLLLRDVQPDDLDDMFEIVGDPIAMKHMPKVYTRDEAKTLWIDRIRMKYEKEGHSFYAVTLAESGEFLGLCGLLEQKVGIDDEVELFTEIGYHFKRKQWGHGYASEAAITVRNYGFRELKRDRLISLIDPANLPSQRVALRNGMLRVRQGVLLHDIAVDLFQITRGEWNELADKEQPVPLP